VDGVEKRALNEVIDDLESGFFFSLVNGNYGYDLPEDVNELILNILKDAVEKG
jgi:hypothetical protein